MTDAFIVDAVRTAGGRRDGALKDWHPVSLGAAVLDALVERTGVDPASIDDVIVGCVSQIGEQSFHVGRNMVLASSLPDSVPAVTIDRQCGSSQQSIHFAAQAVMSGTQDLVIAAVNQGLQKAQELMTAEMQSVAGGMNIFINSGLLMRSKQRLDLNRQRLIASALRSDECRALICRPPSRGEEDRFDLGPPFSIHIDFRIRGAVSLTQLAK